MQVKKLVKFSKEYVNLLERKYIVVAANEFERFPIYKDVHGLNANRPLRVKYLGSQSPVGPGFPNNQVLYEGKTWRIGQRVSILFERMETSTFEKMFTFWINNVLRNVAVDSNSIDLVISKALPDIADVFPEQKEVWEEISKNPTLNHREKHIKYLEALKLSVPDLESSIGVTLSYLRTAFNVSPSISLKKFKSINF